MLKTTFAVAAALACTHAAATITFYQGEGFRGPAVTLDKPVGNMERIGFNDRASSAIIDHGRWEVCEDAGFGGRCVVLRRGNYDSLRSMGLNNNISSVRPVGERVRMEAEVAPPPVAPVYEYRQRPNERIYQAQVTSARAVVGPPEQRCWVEKEQVAGRAEPNVGGAIVGGILGGVLGHQIGSGRGNDAATAIGAVGGAAIGSQAGRSGGTYTRDVQRCENVAASGPPAYWDVSYVFRGQEHHVQMASQPGPSITVNERGEPRG
jgi:uncharacterized protein YcfJ